MGILSAGLLMAVPLINWSRTLREFRTRPLLISQTIIIFVGYIFVSIGEKTPPRVRHDNADLQDSRATSTLQGSWRQWSVETELQIVDISEAIQMVSVLILWTVYRDLFLLARLQSRSAHPHGAKVSSSPVLHFQIDINVFLEISAMRIARKSRRSAQS